MNTYDLDKTLLQFGRDEEKSYWTARQACENLQVFGALGSGKTSGSGGVIARKYLLEGWGGLVLCVKNTECDLWRQYCEDTGRSDDLIIISPQSGHRFNFIEFESRSSENHEALTTNIVDLLKTVIRAGDEQANFGDNDGIFWDKALTMLMEFTVDLSLLAYGKVQIETMYNILQSVPGMNDTGSDKKKKNEPTAFEVAYELATQNVASQVEEWKRKQTFEFKATITDQASYIRAVHEAVPDSRTLDYTAEFFHRSFKELSPKTKSIVEFIFLGFMHGLLRNPFYSLFCNKSSTVVMDDCCKGKIIVIDLPLQKFQGVGKSCQLMVKYCFQRAMQKRKVDDSTLPCFLWCDEGHLLLHEHDQEFLSVSRASRVATVTISQNLSNFFSALGGDKAEHKVRSMLGNTGTHIYHANACTITNEYASSLISEVDMTDPSISVSIGNDSFTQSQNTGVKLERLVKPAEFISLKTGGPANYFKVQGIIHCQGNPPFNGRNFKRVCFHQTNTIFKS